MSTLIQHFLLFLFSTLSTLMQHFVDFKTAHDFSTLKQHPVDFSVGTRANPVFQIQGYTHCFDLKLVGAIFWILHTSQVHMDIKI